MNSESRCHTCGSQQAPGTGVCSECGVVACIECDAILWGNRRNLCGACLEWPPTRMGLGGLMVMYKDDPESWMAYSYGYLKRQAAALGWDQRKHDIEWAYENLRATSGGYEDLGQDPWYPNPIDFDVTIEDRNTGEELQATWVQFIARTADDWVDHFLWLEMQANGGGFQE